MISEKKSQSNSIIIPVFLLIVAIFAYIILKTKGFGNLTYLFDKILSPYTNLLENIAIVLILFATTYLFIRSTARILRRYLEKRGRSKKNIKLFLTVYKYFIWVIVIFVTFSLLFKQVGSLITSLGLIGFGITLALQKPILNFVGWITIIFSRTYQIGDIISINNIIGRVYDVKVMYTNLGEMNEEGDSTGKSVSIPNEFVLTTPVINFTKGTNYLWDYISIPLTYKGNWRKALKITQEVVKNFFNKNIKPGLKSVFKNDFEEYSEIITRVNLYEKGIIIKIRYIVDFDQANNLKTELSKELLNRLKDKDISLGKVESVA